MLGLPEGEEGLLGESGAGGGHGQHEGGDAEGGVDRHEAGAEGGRGALAAEQQQEAEEAHHELKQIFVILFAQCTRPYSITLLPQAEEVIGNKRTIGIRYQSIFEYRVDHLLSNLGWVDLNVEGSTVCIILLGLMEIRQKWLEGG